MNRPLTPREYIMSVVEINERHGMATPSPLVVEAAIEEVEVIVRRWESLSERSALRLALDRSRSVWLTDDMLDDIV